jgi:hypothetical protein
VQLGAIANSPIAPRGLRPADRGDMEKRPDSLIEMNGRDRDGNRSPLPIDALPVVFAPGRPSERL